MIKNRMTKSALMFFLIFALGACSDVQNLFPNLAAVAYLREQKIAPFRNPDTEILYNSGVRAYVVVWSDAEKGNTEGIARTETIAALKSYGGHWAVSDILVSFRDVSSYASSARIINVCLDDCCLGDCDSSDHGPKVGKKFSLSFSYESPDTEILTVAIKREQTVVRENKFLLQKDKHRVWNWSVSEFMEKGSYTADFSAYGKTLASYPFVVEGESGEKIRADQQGEDKG